MIQEIDKKELEKAMVSALNKWIASLVAGMIFGVIIFGWFIA